MSRVSHADCEHGYFLGRGCPECADANFCAHGTRRGEQCGGCDADAERWEKHCAEEAAAHYTALADAAAFDVPTAEEVLADFAARDSLKRWLRDALTLDPVDAARDADLLAAVLRRRCDELLAEATKP